MYISRLLVLLVALSQVSAVANAVEVVFWNGVLLEAVRTGYTPPPQASRAMAMVHAAAFDAVNSLSGEYTPYHQSYTFSPGALGEAAVAQASRDVLASLFPAQWATFDAALANRLAMLPTGPDRDAGVALGASAATGILNLRASDGSGLVVDYFPGGDVGDWRPTPPANANALAPHWPLVAPWTISSGSQFRDPVGPPPIASSEYAADLAEVRDLGSATSATRTADQTEIAQFWADGGGTATPPGHWNRIAQNVVTAEGLSLVESARTFALLNLGLADAAIVSWDNKYAFEFWRPITAIREDGTSPDPAWTPLLTTPPFPATPAGTVRSAVPPAQSWPVYLAMRRVLVRPKMAIPWLCARSPVFRRPPPKPPTAACTAGFTFALTTKTDWWQDSRWECT